MNNDQSKTQSIAFISSSVRELRDRHEKSEEKIQALQVSQGKTEVYCKNIDEKIDDLLRGSKEDREESSKYRETNSKNIQDIKSSLWIQEVKQATESATSNTRWSILGKPISAGVIGAIIATGAKALIDYVKGH